MKKSSVLKKYEEVVRYLIVGVLTTVVSIGTYYLCVYTFLNPKDPIQLQLANILSWISSVTFAYITNRIFVFKSNNQNRIKEAFSFYFSRGLTLVLDISFMFLLVTCIKINDKIAKLLVQFVIIVLNYYISKKMVFKKECYENRCKRV